MDDTTRREFIRSFGIAFLAVAGGRALAGCRRGGEPVDAPRAADGAADAGPAIPRTGPPNAAGAPPESDAGSTTPDAEPAVLEPRARLRAMWLALVPEPTPEDWAAMQGDESRDPRPEREAAHRKALDELVAADNLRAPVADLVQLAFAEVSFHHWRLRLGATC
ncbi:MAG: hypothetical protein JXB32_25120, partial [Deltaproteobacteria bacterium]|nr:hypothetical protein [Deltaproteobacteria bacterium]